MEVTKEVSTKYTIVLDDREVGALNKVINEHRSQVRRLLATELALEYALVDELQAEMGFRPPFGSSK